MIDFMFLCQIYLFFCFFVFLFFSFLYFSASLIFLFFFFFLFFLFYCHVCLYPLQFPFISIMYCLFCFFGFLFFIFVCSLSLCSVVLMNIESSHGRLEIGGLWLCKEAQRSEILSETMFLLFSHIFDSLSYRRVEWKCNTLNVASAQAAQRLGLRKEGVFLKHYWDKGVNRDTEWYAMTDDEWKSGGKREKLNERIRPFKQKKIQAKL